MKLNGLIKKKNRIGSIYYENSNGEIVARQCNKCGEVKELYCFHKHKRFFAGVRSECKACVQKYVVETKEHKREYDKQYRKENTLRISEYYKQYYADEENKERKRENNKHWYEDNKERKIEQSKQWYINNRERYNENARRRVQNRRSRKRQLPNTLTKEQDTKLLEIQNNKCLLTNESKNLNLEHFIPISIGHGGTTFENCYYMEGSLNQSKYNHNPFEWIQTQSEDVQKRFYCLLVPILAKRHGMSVKEFENYVNYCFENPRTIEELSNDAV